jgi:hypothetical protein
MGTSRAMLEVDRVIGIEVGPVGNTIRVATPESASHASATVDWVETEGFRVLSQAIDVWIVRKRGLDSKILVFENQRVVDGGEQLFAGRATRNSERKGVGGIVEAKLWFASPSGLRTRENIFWNFIAFLRSILDLDMKPGI